MGTVLDDRQEELCAASRWDFSDLRALFVNCTLKRSPEVSNTQCLRQPRVPGVAAGVRRRQEQWCTSASPYTGVSIPTARALSCRARYSE
jgi:hypothetical protein